jgi:hypothetical protein
MIGDLGIHRYVRSVVTAFDHTYQLTVVWNYISPKPSFFLFGSFTDANISAPAPLVLAISSSFI